MTQEVLKTVCGMDLNNVNTQMALQCAPLIAGIKISNLFIIDNSSIQDALYAFKKYKLSYYFLLRTAKKTTFLLYDRDGLENYLRDESVSELLGQQWPDGLSPSVQDQIQTIRFREQRFPSRTWIVPRLSAGRCCRIHRECRRECNLYRILEGICQPSCQAEAVRSVRARQRNHDNAGCKRIGGFS